MPMPSCDEERKRLHIFCMQIYVIVKKTVLETVLYGFYMGMGFRHLPAGAGGDAAVYMCMSVYVSVCSVYVSVCSVYVSVCSVYMYCIPACAGGDAAVLAEHAVAADEAAVLATGHLYVYVCMYMCVYVYVYVCVCVCVCVCISMYVCISRRR
jgi:hypothetical protein